MSTSDNMFRRNDRAMKVYLGIGVFCILFSFIYAQFSHGVHSNFMTYMCLIPLIGGAGLFALMRVLRVKAFGRFSFNAYNSGIATLTIASVLRGIFDIAGTASAYMGVFVIAGVVCLAAAGIGALVEDTRCARSSHAPAEEHAQHAFSADDARPGSHTPRRAARPARMQADMHR